MKKAILVWFCVAALVAAGCSPSADNADSFGSVGTLGDSWIEIRDWYDLDAIRNDMNSNYVLMTDLDSSTAGYDELAGPTANDGKGWEPIGVVHDWFTGIFDGQGFEIGDLFIDRPDEHNVGLFGFLHKGVIRNIGVVNTDITGHQAVGGLTGTAFDGTVSYAHSTGSVTGFSEVGGLVGLNWINTVSNSHSIAMITGSEKVGGLVGYNWCGIVSNSYYEYDEVLINGDNMITIGALSAEDFEEWLANDKFLNVNDRLSHEDGYYLVNDLSDLRELLAFGQDESLRFRLKGDLDLGDEVDFYIPYLAGEFHGNGHTIRNLSVSFHSVSHVGLFGYLARGGAVTQVRVEDVDVTGYSDVGGVVGYSSQGSVSNSYSSGSVIGTGWWCFAGGLVGRSEWGSVISSSSTAIVVGWGRYVGGLVGYSRGYGQTVSKSYAAGSVTGYERVGGLVGGCYQGDVSNSYSVGSVHGEMLVGGLVGVNWLGNVYNCYSFGRVSGIESVGGLVGLNEATVSNCFWDVATSQMDESDGGTGKTTAEMKDINTFLAAGWDIETTTEANPTHGYPFLAWRLGSSPVWYISALPTVTTEPATGITTDSATLNMSFTVGDHSPVEVRFAYRKTTDAAWTETSWVWRAEDGAYVEILVGLDSNTTYEFKAQLQCNPEIGGEVLTFTTAKVEPTVATGAATDVTTDSATLNMSYTVGDYSPVEVRFRWREEGAIDWITTAWADKADSGSHSETITGLDSDATYEFKAQLRCNGTVTDGATLTFTTAPEPVLTYGLTISSTDGGSATQPGEGRFTYDEVTVVALVAEADTGHHFVNWTGDVSTIDNVNSAETTITMEGDYSITANFRSVGGCLIATAAYGTPMAEEVQILREFRNRYLLTNLVGQAVVDFYYMVSPPIADFITEYPNLKPIVRVGLMPTVALSTVVVNTTPAEKAATIGFIAMASVTLSVWVVKRRRRGPEYA